MDDDMATPIDELPGPQHLSTPREPTQDLVEQQRQPKVTFDDTPVEIPNFTFDIKKRNESNSQNEFKSLLTKKTLYESTLLVALYVLLSQPFIVYRLGNLLGSRFGSNVTLQLVVRGLLLVVGYYAFSLFVLPKLN